MCLFSFYSEHVLFTAVRSLRSIHPGFDITSIEELAELTPWNGRVLHVYSSVLAANRRWDEAIELLAHASELDPDYFIRLNLAYCYENVDRFDEALGEYRRILSFAPFSPETLKALDMHLQQRILRLQGNASSVDKERLKSAIDMMEFGLYQHEDFQALKLAVLYYLDTAEFPAPCTQIKSGNLSDAWCYLIEVRKLLREGKESEALKKAWTIIRIDQLALKQFLPNIYMNLYTLLETNPFKSTEFQIDSLHIRALILAAGGNKTMAIRYIDEALAMDPTLTDCLNLRNSLLNETKMNENQ